MTQQPTGRSIDLSIDVPGSPEAVWEAIATGPGITSWFIPASLEGRVGGEITFDFGGFGTDTGSVTAWEPPHRLAYTSGGDRPLAYEWLVEARAGGRCTVRLVNSGFGTGEEWDGDYDGMSGGWQVFLESLRQHLTHFAGRHARATIPTVMVPGPHARAWSALCAALGVPEDLAVGQQFVTAGGAPALAGTVVATNRMPAVTAYHLVLEPPGSGRGFVTAEGEGDQVACSVYLYRYGAAEADDDWPSWLAGLAAGAGTTAPSGPDAPAPSAQS